MPKRIPHDPKRSARLAWLSQNICQGQTDVQIIIKCMTAFPGTSEITARKDLREIYARFGEIRCENLAEQKIKYQEVLWADHNNAINSMQFNAAAQFIKLLMQSDGCIEQEGKSDKNPANPQPTPAPEIVRERIAELLRNKQVQETAKEAGIDLRLLSKDKNKDES